MHSKYFRKSSPKLEEFFDSWISWNSKADYTIKAIISKNKCVIVFIQNNNIYLIAGFIEIFQNSRIEILIRQRPLLVHTYSCCSQFMHGNKVWNLTIHDGLLHEWCAVTVSLWSILLSTAFTMRMRISKQLKATAAYKNTALLWQIKLT